jgi:hypothetical protein
MTTSIKEIFNKEMFRGPSLTNASSEVVIKSIFLKYDTDGSESIDKKEFSK